MKHQTMANLFLFLQIATTKIDNIHKCTTMTQNNMLTTSPYNTPQCCNPAMAFMLVQQVHGTTPDRDPIGTLLAWAPGGPGHGFTNSGNSRNHGTGNNITPNKHHRDLHQKPHGLVLPSFPNEGESTKACCTSGTGGSLAQAAKMATQLYKVWFSEESELNQVDCIQCISKQPAPFPLLAINAYGNTVSILHWVKKFVANPTGLCTPCGCSMTTAMTFSRCGCHTKTC